MKRPQPPHDRQILATRPGLGLFRYAQHARRLIEQQRREQHERMKRAIQERFKPSIRIVQPLATDTHTVH